MGGILMMIVYLVSAVTCLGIAWAAGRYAGRNSAQDQIDQLQEVRRRQAAMLQSDGRQIDYLLAQNDRWHQRCRALETRLMEGFHLQAMPPAVMPVVPAQRPTGGITGSLQVLTPEIMAGKMSPEQIEAREVMAANILNAAFVDQGTAVVTPGALQQLRDAAKIAPGPKEPPTPPNHKEVG